LLVVVALVVFSLIENIGSIIYGFPK
jgi:hypothetical protein